MASLAILGSLLLLLRSLARADSCIWETSNQKSRYSYNLAGPLNGYHHGIRSEDGFYKVTGTNADGDSTVFYFQLCEHMKFNFDPPICEKCEQCGGPDHCGETCSALQQVSYSGFAVCETLGYSSSLNFSLIDKKKPEQGVLATMTAGNCSFAVSVHCNSDGEEFPASVSSDSAGGCHYKTSMKHPAGCPVVTRLDAGGLGWFSTLLIVLLCLFLVYMMAATVYRRQALGIMGTEAVPHMDFWRSIPSNIQLGAEYMIGKVTGLYRQATERSYVRVNDS